MAETLRADLYAADGTRKGDVVLDPALFGLEPNVPVMHQVVTAQLAGARRGTASTKTRAEVAGGGRKPWRQKGLGRARHGSIRSPQWKGGGVVFGPRPRSFAQRTPKKMKRLALRSALSARAGTDSVKVVEGYDWTVPKTKEARAFLEEIGLTGKVLVVIDPTDHVASRSFNNLPNVALVHPGQLTTYDVLWSDAVLFTRATLASLTGGATDYEVSESDFVREREEGGEAT